MKTQKNIRLDRIYEFKTNKYEIIIILTDLKLMGNEI